MIFNNGMTYTNIYRIDANNIIKAYKSDEEAFKLVEQSALQDELSSSFSSKSRVVFPLINFVTDTLSKTYTEKVTRELDEKNKNNKELQKLLIEVNEAYNKISTTLDKYTFLTGTTALKPHYNADLNKFKFIVFTSNMIEYTPHYNDKTEADEILISYYFNNILQQELWSNNYYSILVDDKEIENNINMYNEIPFVFFKNNNDNLEFYDKPKKNLLEMQNMLSKKLINTDATFKKQGNSLLIAKGISDIKEIKIGPNSLNSLPSDASLEYVNPNVDLNNMLNFLNEEFKLLSKLNGIPDSLFSVNANNSGVSIIASQKVIAEYVKNRQKIFRKKEEEAIEMGIKVLAFHKNISIPEDFEISVSYKRIIEPLNSDEIKQWEFYIGNNIYTPVDLLMQIEDISREEAETKIKNNKDLNNLVKNANNPNNLFLN